MSKKSKNILKIAMIAFFAFVLLWLSANDFRIIKIWLGLPVGYHDIPGWEVQMTDEQLKEHLGEEQYNKMKDARKNATVPRQGKLDK